MSAITAMTISVTTDRFILRLIYMNIIFFKNIRLIQMIPKSNETLENLDELTDLDYQYIAFYSFFQIEP